MPRVLSQSDVAGFRERLCEVATRIFVEKGRDGFNMRQLAAQLGVSAMTPYRYFENKDEILAAVSARAFGRFADQLEAALSAPGAPQEKSARVGRAYVRFALEESPAYRLMFDPSGPRARAVPELLAAEKRARATMTAHVRLMVEAGLYQGEPELIGHVIWSAMHGVVLLHFAGKLNRPDFETLLAETIRVMTSAYRTVPQS